MANARKEMRKLGRYSLCGSEWNEVSDEAKDLIKKLLVKNAKVRLSAEDILIHPWITAIPTLELEMESKYNTLKTPKNIKRNKSALQISKFAESAMNVKGVITQHFSMRDSLFRKERANLYVSKSKSHQNSLHTSKVQIQTQYKCIFDGKPTVSNHIEKLVNIDFDIDKSEGRTLDIDSQSYFMSKILMVSESLMYVGTMSLTKHYSMKAENSKKSIEIGFEQCDTNLSLTKTQKVNSDFTFKAQSQMIQHKIDDSNLHAVLTKKSNVNKLHAKRSSLEKGHAFISYNNRSYGCTHKITIKHPTSKKKKVARWRGTWKSFKQQAEKHVNSLENCKVNGDKINMEYRKTVLEIHKLLAPSESALMQRRMYAYYHNVCRK